MKKISKIFLKSFLGKIFIYIFGYCPVHGWGGKVEKFRMNTAYVKEENNYGYGCKKCQKESYDYYQELWDEYYKGLL